jgi:hypothetical protein
MDQAKQEQPNDNPILPLPPRPGIVPPAADTIKTITVDGYSFKVDTERIDDVDVLDIIDDIESKQHMKSVITLLVYLLGQDGYDQLKNYFVEKYGHLKISKLGDLYTAIFEQFDPKG